MRLGFSVPVLHSVRGGGLANEAIPWAKAFIGARELGLRLVAPPWGLNPRGYSADFGTSRADVVAYRALRALPAIRITPDAVRATGEVDYGRALRALAPELGLSERRAFAVTHESMEGGWLAIRSAREFLRAQLLRPGHVAADLYAISQTLRPDALTVGMHLRFGDFSPTEHGPRPGSHNERLPDSWYEGVADALERAFEDRVEIVLVTDDPQAPVVTRLLERRSAVVPPQRARPLLSDLLLLANADFLVCSTSAFSQLAAFLSGSPYAWFEPHLNDHDGWRSIWGHEEAAEAPGTTLRNLAAADGDGAGRGFPVRPDGSLDDELVALLAERLRLKQADRDLLQHGIVRAQ